ncbi:hypothetical protein AGMMS49983_03320 [Clostridia bacterium]|nr:hypothetical protein AGMMS49983_03320 [Clostridia bacterium]
MINPIGFVFVSAGSIINVVQNGNEQITYYEGIPSQSVFQAILTCKISIMKERLEDAVSEAQAQGLISEKEATLAPIFLNEM